MSWAPLVYGILQERIMTRPYGEGEDEEFFTFSVFLVMNNRLVSMCVAVIVLAIIRGAVAPVAPIYKYAAVSCSNVIATTCQYEALKYVSFPVQTLGKCAKIEEIPVMIWGYFISNKRYGLYDYLIATGVMVGCTIFALYGPTTSSHGGGGKKSEKETGMYGIALMGGYLGFDGFTSTFQDKLFTGYQMETYNQMLWVNFCSAVISSFWLMSDSSMGDAIAFVKKHPAAMSDALVLSAASTLGQLCILFTIKGVWRAALCDDHDHQAVPVHPAVVHPIHAPAHVAAVDRHHHGVLRALRQGHHRRDEEEGAQAGQARPRGGLRR